MHNAGGFSPPALSALRKSFLQSLSATRHSGRLSIFLLIHFRRHCHDSIQRPHSRKPATKQQRYRTILFLLFHLIFPTTHSFIISYFLCIFSRHRFAFPSLHIHHTPCIISSTCVEQPIPSTPLQTDQSSSLFLHLWLSAHESRTEPSRICILTTNRAYHMVFLFNRLPILYLAFIASLITLFLRHTPHTSTLPSAVRRFGLCHRSFCPYHITHTTPFVSPSHDIAHCLTPPFCFVCITFFCCRIPPNAYPYLPTACPFWLVLYLYNNTSLMESNCFEIRCLNSRENLGDGWPLSSDTCGSLGISHICFISFLS